MTISFNEIKLIVALATGKVFEHGRVAHHSAQMTAWQ